jgi:hypothetical protein
MKKYNAPSIKAIPLHPEQAILNVCAVGGNYIQAAGYQCNLGGGSAWGCATYGRGQTRSVKTATMGGQETFNAPS